MQLKDNWKEILTKAWSMRLMSGFEVALPVIREIIEPLQIVPTGVFAILSFVATAAAGIARVMAQPKAGL